MQIFIQEQIRKLKSFNAAPGDDVIQWLYDTETVFDSVQLRPSNKYIAVQSYLVGAAAKWFRFNKMNIPDWSSFKIAIVQAYQPSIHQALLKMEQRHQLMGESVMEYYYDKLHLSEQADPNMSSSMLIHYLTKGLNEALLPHVIRRHPVTPNDFLTFAQDEEKILSTLNGLSYASTNEPVRYPNEDIHMDHIVNVVKHPINMSNRSFNWQHHQSPPQPLMNVPTTPFSSSSRRSYSQHRPSSSTSRQCYACYGFGHIAQYCPNRKNV